MLINYNGRHVLIKGASGGRMITVGSIYGPINTPGMFLEILVLEIDKFRGRTLILGEGGSAIWILGWSEIKGNGSVL